MGISIFLLKFEIRCNYEVVRKGLQAVCRKLSEFDYVVIHFEDRVVTEETAKNWQLFSSKN